MSDRNHQCQGCGRYIDFQGRYFTDEFASCLSTRKPRHYSVWCSNCGVVTIYRPSRIFGFELIIGGKQESVSLDHFCLQSKYGQALDEFGFSCRTHLIRRIWHSCCDACVTIKDQDPNYQQAFDLILSKISPPLAFMLTVQLSQHEMGLSAYAPMITIDEGRLLMEKKWFLHLDSWIENASDKSRASELKQMYDQYKSGEQNAN